jgi:penicillin-binding protein 1A
VGYPNALREMRSVHGRSVAGGTFPAEIWHDFMVVAKGSNCRRFPQPTQRARFTPFFGKHSSTGRRTDGYRNGGGYYAPAPRGPGDNSAGGRDYRGYDPRLYESPPQRPPSTSPPREPDRGGGGGGRGGGGQGDGGAGGEDGGEGD